MSKDLALIGCGILAVLALSGCQNSGKDSDEYSYDSVGEQHVYDQPKKVLPTRQEFTAPPTAHVLQKRPSVATKTYDHIGEENVFDE